jgi:HK97 family phage portal protein
VSLLLDGTAFIPVMRDASNRPTSLTVLDPTRVHMHRQNGVVQVIVDGNVAPMDMLIIRGLMLPGAIRGLSPVEYARQIIGLGLGAQDQAARFFGQGAVVPGVIQTSGSLTKEQMREIRDQWLQSHGGSRRSHLPVVLTGDAKWQGITMTQEQAQFLETRRYTDAQIAGQMFRVDPTMLGIPVEGSSITYSNLEQRGTHLCAIRSCRGLSGWSARCRRFCLGASRSSSMWRACCVPIWRLGMRVIRRRLRSKRRRARRC